MTLADQLKDPNAYRRAQFPPEHDPSKELKELAIYRQELSRRILFERFSQHWKAYCDLCEQLADCMKAESYLRACCETVVARALEARQAAAV